MHDMPVVDLSEKARVEFPQGAGRQKAAVIIKVSLVRKIDGPGHMSGHGIDGLGFTLEAFTGAGIDKDDEAVCEFRPDFRRTEPQAVVSPVIEVFLFHDGLRTGHRTMPGHPFLPAAVEHGDAMMAKPAHHPPESYGIGAVGGVIGNDLGFIADTPAFKGFGKSVRFRQGVAANRGCHGCGEILVQMGVARSRNMRGLPLSSSRIGPHEVEAAINHDKVVCLQILMQSPGVDEGGVLHAGFSCPDFAVNLILPSVEASVPFHGRREQINQTIRMY